MTNLGANHPYHITRDDGGKSWRTLNLTDVLSLCDRSIDLTPLSLSISSEPLPLD